MFQTKMLPGMHHSSDFYLNKKTKAGISFANFTLPGKE